MARSIIPHNLPDLVRDRFDSAKESGALTFWPTEVDIVPVNGVPFQLRFCPTLANKPKADKSSDGKKAFDPFLDPPEALFIADILPNHILVLNKFAIVREHFILATKEFKKQTEFLEPGDLEATFACLKAWRAHGKELFAFFNSGEHSGASQPHRHIQLLPVESMTEGVKDGEWKPIADIIANNPALGLPFTCFSARISDSPTGEELSDTYMSLYRQAETLFRSHNDANDDGNLASFVSGDDQSNISYNLGMTDKSMVLCPRRSEGATISSAKDNSSSIGPISLNGTLLAGTLLIKNEVEWHTLRENVSQLVNVLEKIGIPTANSSEEKL